MPPGASAAGDESRIGAPGRTLTLNGQPLALLLNGKPEGYSGWMDLWQGTGQIAGVALDEDGQSATGETVQLRHVGPPTEVVDRTTTDANGRFSFAALGAGRYIVDLRIAGKVVATSGPISLAEGGVTFTQVGGIAVRQSPTDDGKGRSVLFWTAVGAGVGGGLGLMSNAGVDCDHPENLCGLRSIGGAVMGALAGLMIGTAR